MPHCRGVSGDDNTEIEIPESTEVDDVLVEFDHKSIYVFRVVISMPIVSFIIG